jgi:hypothetical protein
MFPGQPSYAASKRNGVQSHAYGQYSSSYRLQRAIDQDDAKDPQGPLTPNLQVMLTELAKHKKLLDQKLTGIQERLRRLERDVESVPR